MKTCTHDFENLRKANKYGPSIKKTYEVNIISVGGLPIVYLRHELKYESMHMECDERSKKGLYLP